MKALGSIYGLTLIGAFCFYFVLPIVLFIIGIILLGIGTSCYKNNFSLCYGSEISAIFMIFFGVIFLFIIFCLIMKKIIEHLREKRNRNNDFSRTKESLFVPE
jgi:chromate transport protein ChrA